MKISDKKVLKIIKDLGLHPSSSRENLMKEAVIAKLQLLIDIRQLLTKISKGTGKCCSTHKRPTEDKNDIIVGA